MKAKTSFSCFVEETSKKGTLGQIFSGIVLFIALFAVWSFSCFGGACVDLAKRYI